MDWLDLDFFKSRTFSKILDFLKEEAQNGKIILPSREKILNAMVLTPLDETKVVVLGQDPYPNREHAIGLAFAVNNGVNPLPKSLANIFRELQDDIGTTRTNGDLSDWAKQGVLLLNTALTVVEGKPASHSKIGWSRLVRDAIAALNEQREGVVFVLWGKHAQGFEMYVDQNRHHIIKSVHPSPLSARRGFFGSKPFSKTNDILIDNGEEPINW